jgi:hypothetical protein
MALGKISNYAMVDGMAEIKAPIAEPSELSWPDEDQRSK